MAPITRPTCFRKTTVQRKALRLEEICRLGTNSYVIHEGNWKLKGYLRRNEVSCGGCDVTVPVLQVEANIDSKAVLV